MELMIVTQCWENYGTADEPYWKPKGALFNVIENAPEGLSSAALTGLSEAFTHASDYYMELALVKHIEPNGYNADECEGVIDYADAVNMLIEEITV